MVRGAALRVLPPAVADERGGGPQLGWFGAESCSQWPLRLKRLIAPELAILSHTPNAVIVSAIVRRLNWDHRHLRP